MVISHQTLFYSNNAIKIIVNDLITLIQFSLFINEPIPNNYNLETLKLVGSVYYSNVLKFF